MNTNTNSKTILSMKETEKATSLSRANINRYREIGDFPEAIELNKRRIVFVASEVDEWIGNRPRKKGSEVNDNKRRVRCPQTLSELEEARLQDYAVMKANKQWDGA